MGTLSQPSRLGGDKIMPALLFNGPPQEIPTDLRSSAVQPCKRISSSSSPTSFSMTVSGEPSVLNSMRDKKSNPFAVSSPSITAHFVPPMSKPANFMCFSFNT